MPSPHATNHNAYDDTYEKAKEKHGGAQVPTSQTVAALRLGTTLRLRRAFHDRCVLSQRCYGYLWLLYPLQRLLWLFEPFVHSLLRGFLCASILRTATCLVARGFGCAILLLPPKRSKPLLGISTLRI